MPDPGATIVPLSIPIVMSGQNWNGVAIAMTQHGATMQYLVTRSGGAPQWVEESEVERTEAAPR